MVGHPALIDVSPGLRRVDMPSITLSLNRALTFGGTSAPGASGRYDAAGLIGSPDLLDTWARHVDGLCLRELGDRPLPACLQPQGRTDALPAGAPGFARQFEHIRSQILEERRQPLNAMRMFPIDGSVPLGARKHTTRRALGSGEAQIYRGGDEIPRAQSSYAEETFGVAYVVCAVDTQFFDLLTTDWAGLQQYQRDLRLAMRLVEERLNRICFTGAAEAGLYGVLNYPHLAKQVMSVDFTDDSAPEDIAAALYDLATTPLVESGGTFAATAMDVSPRLHQFLFSRKHSSTGGTDLSIGEYFLKSQQAGGQGIRSIGMAQELAGIGPNSEDGILCYRPDLDTVGHVLIQAPSVLPVYQASPLEQTTVVFAATGGVTMPDVGNAILGFADAVQD